ncbi:unnamed protein product [Calicophoron daubneyi]|uniref:AP-3 complex subunit delta n=1 Tax=Calicophoron daubneyi TaxID=300641 RepID=A0AAV2TQD9_CALDB
MALSAVKGTLERVLDKNLQDLVRGIRNHKNDETKYINGCLEEIKNELKQGSFASKENAVAKLFYLQMLGYDVSWAVFNIVEVMSCPRFGAKRLGYLAASQIFGPKTDVLMLTTNLIRKDLSKGNIYDTGAAISGLACFITPDLAMNLYNDILALMASTQPYLRKKAVLLLYRVFLNHPEALKVCFPRLKERLEDSDPGVQSAAVNVICELARRNPKNYLSLAPIFFKLMTSSTNNWVLIKIIKLFGAMTPIEPRLGKKLIEPLTNLIHSTSAMSLLYECINTVIAVLLSISSGIPNHHASIQLCVQKLRILIEDSDQNLKYLGLLAMTKILEYHPKSVQSHKDMIFCCLDDKDESIRLRALNLLHGMVTKKNLMEIVKCLIRHVGDASGGMHYRNELVGKIVHICSQDDYQFVTSFEWYISVLVELARIDNIRNGELLSTQLMDVAIRVPSVRQFSVTQMALLLDMCASDTVANRKNAIYDVVHAAAWICGEYAKWLENPRQTLESILRVADMVGLSAQVQSMMLMNAFKLFCALVSEWTRDTKLKMSAGHSKDTPSREIVLHNLLDRLLELVHFLEDQFTLFVHSPDLEVQERAVSLHQLLSLVNKRLSKMEAALIGSLQHLLSPDGNSTTGRGDARTILTDDLSVNSGDFDVTVSKSSLSSDSVADTVFAFLSSLTSELASLFAGEINPVAPKAQKKVPIPEGLDLDAWINPPAGYGKFGEFSHNGSASERTTPQKRKSEKPTGPKQNGNDIFPNLPSNSPRLVLTQEEMEEARRLRIEQQRNNPNYLKPTAENGHHSLPEQLNFSSDSSSKPVSDHSPTTGRGLAQHPRKENSAYEFARSDLLAEEVQRRFIQLSAKEKEARIQTQKLKKREKRKKVSQKAKEDASAGQQQEETTAEPNGTEMTGLEIPVVSVVLDAPEGIGVEDDSSTDDSNDPHRRLNISLDDIMSQSKSKKAPFPKNRGSSAAVPSNSDLPKKADEASLLVSQNADPQSSVFNELSRPSKSTDENSLGKNRNRETPSRRSDYSVIKSHKESSKKGGKVKAEPKPGHFSSVSQGNAMADCQMFNNSSAAKLEITPPDNQIPTRPMPHAFTPNPITSDAFANILSGPRLMCNESVKVRCPLAARAINSGQSALMGQIFSQIVQAVAQSVPCSVIECIESRASSLYTESEVSHEPVCILLKLSHRTGSVSIEVKSATASATLASLELIKTAVRHASASS